MAEILSSGPVSTRLRRIAELAKTRPGVALTSVAHVIDESFLLEAFRRTRKDGAVGIDGQTAEAYAIELAANLRSLLDRFRSGAYHAPSVRRVRIPKGDGTSTRPIGIPTFEDKVLQRAVSMVLEAVYEPIFHDGSFGFRPNRSAHGALETLRRGIWKMGGGWVIEVDIKSFFDTLHHGHLRSFLDQRVRDGVLRRTIDKWLSAGVLEDGSVHHPDSGTPQGGVISPLLANIYLHEVLDQWFESAVRPRMRGECFLVRYADDFVMGFASEADARRVMEVLPKRFEKYGLTLHPEKTRLVPFRRGRYPSEIRRGDRVGGPPPGSFDFLGFSLFWGKSREGKYMVRQKTAKSRQTRTLKRISEWCRRNRHLKVSDQHRALVAKLRGHYGYFGVTGNSRMLESLRYEVGRIWKKWLSRRSQRAWVTRERFRQILEKYPLPLPVIVHSVFRTAANP